MAPQLMTREREQLRETLDRWERGLSRAPTLYRLGYLNGATKRNRLMTFVASTEDEDRGRDVIRQDGWELDNFRKNPVYMWAHDYRRTPIGTVPRVWVENRILFNTVRFDEDDAFAADIARKYRSGVLRAQSVGFRPLEFEERRGGGFEFTRAELLEISGVAIPMNAHALRKGLTAARAWMLFQDALNGADDPFERFARHLRRWDRKRRSRRHLTRSEVRRFRAAMRRIRTG